MVHIWVISLLGWATTVPAKMLNIGSSDPVFATMLVRFDTIALNKDNKWYELEVVRPSFVNKVPFDAGACSTNG